MHQRKKILQFQHNLAHHKLLHNKHSFFKPTDVIKKNRHKEIMTPFNFGHQGQT